MCVVVVVTYSVRMLRHLLDAGADINLAGLVLVPSHMQLMSVSSGSESDDAGTVPACDEARQLTCSPLQFAIVSRAWDVAELLIHAGCETLPVASWLDPGGVGPSPVAVTVPHEHASYLRRVIAVERSSPARLGHLARLSVRRLLGRHLTNKLSELNLPLSTQQYLLFYDLFRAHSGTFDI